VPVRQRTSNDRRVVLGGTDERLERVIEPDPPVASLPTTWKLAIERKASANCAGAGRGRHGLGSLPSSFARYRSTRS
jgi:hypothetical protein